MKNNIKEFIKIPNFSESERCYYPIRCDVYGKGCQHNCLYCYARALNSKYKDQWNPDNISYVNIEEVEKIFYNAFILDKKNQRSCLLRKKIPLRLGGLTDLFQPYEREKNITFALINILNKYQYPYLIVTKSSLLGEDKYLRILDKNLCYVQMTITTLNNNLLQIIEPNASKFSDRLNCLKKLIDIGIYTSVRVSPIIPIYKDGYYSRNEDNYSKNYNYFSFDLIDSLCEIKPNTLIAEFLRISPMTKKILNQYNMNNIVDLFDSKNIGKDGTLHFSKEEKEYYFEKIQSICKKKNVEFSVCDDFHYEYFKKYWVNKNDCCNGLGKIAGFNKTFKDYT